MLRLTLPMLRRRAGGSIATLVALAAGVMILTAMGALVQSGLFFKTTPQRYAAAAAVVAHRTVTVTAKDLAGETMSTTLALPEGGTVPADLVERIRRTPGVAGAIADYTIPLAAGTVPVTGHGWGSAALAPYRLVAGSPPGPGDEVVADSRLGLRTGDRVDLVVGGASRAYRISGIASGPQAAVFFTDARAAQLNPHPGRVDAVGVLAAPGTDRAALVDALDRLASAAGVETYAGDDLGGAEQSDTAAARDLLIQAGGAFGGYVVLLIVFVISGTIGLSIRHRRRDLALLRAIAATPGQVRRMIATEAALTAVAASVLGVPAGLLATRWVHGQLVGRGFLPAGFPIDSGALASLAAVAVTVLVAVCAALIAGRRVAAIRPTEALGEVSVEPGRGGRVRFVSGLVALAGAVCSSAATTATGGQAALTAAIGMLYLFVLAVALLAPWINRYAARLLAPVLRTVWGASGHLAAANLRANAKGSAAVLTALVLSVGFGGSVWFLQDNLQRQTVVQSRDGMLAQYALVSPAGLPAAAASEARKISGVVAATPVRHTSVLVTVFGGDAQVVAAQAVGPDIAATVDLKVREGSIADLRGAGMAVSAIQASTSGWEVGDRVGIRLADGTPVEVRVAAIYDRGLGFTDVTLPRDLVSGPAASGAAASAASGLADSGLVDEVLVRTGSGADTAALARLASRYPAGSLVPAADLTGRIAHDLAVGAWLNKLLIGVMVGYAALAAANTMVMAALARRRELSLLRLVGVTRSQVKRMVHAEQAALLGAALTIGAAIAALTLTAVIYALTGRPIPYVPVLGWLVVPGGTALLALVTTILPVGRLLRVRPVESIGIKE